MQSLKISVAAKSTHHRSGNLTILCDDPLISNARTKGFTVVSVPNSPLVRKHSSREPIRELTTSQTPTKIFVHLEPGEQGGLSLQDSNGAARFKKLPKSKPIMANLSISSLLRLPIIKLNTQSPKKILRVNETMTPRIQVVLDKMKGKISDSLSFVGKSAQIATTPGKTLGNEEQCFLESPPRLTRYHRLPGASKKILATSEQSSPSVRGTTRETSELLLERSATILKQDMEETESPSILKGRLVVGSLRSSQSVSDFKPKDWVSNLRNQPKILDINRSNLRPGSFTQHMISLNAESSTPAKGISQFPSKSKFKIRSIPADEEATAAVSPDDFY